MQISTPIQALSSPESGYAENSKFVENIYGDSPAGWSQKAQKKNKGGFFAKLLEGLTVKGKKDFGPNGIDGLDSSKRAEGESGPERPGKNSLKSGLGANKTRNSGVMAGINDDAIPGAFSFPGINEFSAEINLDFQAGKGDMRSLRKENRTGTAGRDFLRSAENSSGRTVPGGEVLRELAAGTEYETSDAGFGFSESKGKRNAGISGSDRLKNAFARDGTGNSFSASLKDLEAEILQSQFRSAGLRTENGEKENSRLADIRSKKGRDRFNIEVRDLRSGESKDSGIGGALKDFAPGSAGSLNQEIELPVNLNLLPEKEGKESSGNIGREPSLNQKFEDALASELRGNLSTDIVRDATVIIRNGGEGTIRLSLRPASLGDVKIRLEMTENKITGHIIVESKEALRAFERELPVLEKAFKDSGFSETNLEMFFAQDHGNFSGERQEEDLSAMASVMAASRYESEITYMESLPDLLSNQRGIGLPVSPGRIQVNLLV